MKPNILNPKWKYVPAAATSVKATFARVRREMAAQQKAREEAESKTALKVRRIGTK